MEETSFRKKEASERGRCLTLPTVVRKGSSAVPPSCGCEVKNPKEGTRIVGVRGLVRDMQQQDTLYEVIVNGTTTTTGCMMTEHMQP